MCSPKQGNESLPCPGWSEAPTSHQIWCGQQLGRLSKPVSSGRRLAWLARSFSTTSGPTRSSSATRRGRRSCSRLIPEALNRLSPVSHWKNRTPCVPNRASRVGPSQPDNEWLVFRCEQAGWYRATGRPRSKSTRHHCQEVTHGFSPPPRRFGR
jgi:hypothetical protein